MRPLGWASIQSDWCACKERKLGHKERPQGYVCTEERPCEDTARRHPSTSQKASGDTNPAGTLILDFQPPELEGKKRLLLKLPSLWCLLWQPQRTSRPTQVPAGVPGGGVCCDDSYAAVGSSVPGVPWSLGSAVGATGSARRHRGFFPSSVHLIIPDSG